MLEAVEFSVSALIALSEARKLSIAAHFLGDEEYFGGPISFSSPEEMRAYGFEQSLDEFIQGLVEAYFPERTEVLFDGDRFVPDRILWEEESAPFEEADLPILGQCKVYRSLGRIRYIEETVYADDHDDPATAHYSSASISIEDYLERLKKQAVAIEKAIKIFSSQNKGAKK